MSIQIIYSTVGGSTGLVVDLLEDYLEKAGLEIQKNRVDNLLAKDIQKVDLIILASPTYNQGTVDDHFKKFLSSFQKNDWSGQKFAVIGLGDPKYYLEYLTESAVILEDIINKTGGEILIPALRIGMPPIKLAEKLVPKWADKIIEILKPTKK